MTSTIIITICLLLLAAYVFDLSSSRTKVPSVLLLMLLGWLAQQVIAYSGIEVPELHPILPVLGTIGLILIVLEGSMELEFNRDKLPLVGKTFILAMLPILLLSSGVALVLYLQDGTNIKNGLANALPLAVISSSIAIPSAQNLAARHREFITYESSFSDIIGVILFNFITLNAVINWLSFGHFVLQLGIMVVVTFIATIGLAYLLSQIKHHIKFTPIILMVILIYAISKVFHLPGLIFILIFGLFLANVDQFPESRLMRLIRPDILDTEVHKFREITTELAFLVRSLFFLVFGYQIKTHELLNAETLYWSLGITAAIFATRLFNLKIFRLPLQPLLFIAPRGLITILLFLSIPAGQETALINNSVVIQVIIFTALIMMSGVMLSREKPGAVV